MPTPVCSVCQLGMKPERNGVTVIETAYHPPLPYKIWSADEWMCHGCGQTIIVGFSERSIDNWNPIPMIEALERCRTNLNMVRIWREWNTPILIISDELLAGWIRELTPKENADGSM